MESLKEYFISRLREASTWRGIMALLTAAGVALDPNQIEAIVSAGLAIIGVIGLFFSDAPAKK